MRKTMECFQHGETALHFASGAGHIDIVKLLADRKATLTVVDGVSDRIGLVAEIERRE